MLATKWTSQVPAEYAGNWAVTGSAALWLLNLNVREEVRDPNDVDILVDGLGMLNGYYILGKVMKMETKQKDPNPNSGARTFTSSDGTKVDLINVSRFKVAVDFSEDVTYVLSIPVLTKEKLLAFQEKRENTL